MKFVKSLLALLLALTCLMGCCADTIWDDEADEDGYYWYEEPFYMVFSFYAERGQQMIYMYAAPSSQGNPIAQYDNGTLVKVFDYDADKTYCYAQGPDGMMGYLRKEWLVSFIDVVNNNDPYCVNSEYSERGRYLVYMYAEPSPAGEPIGTYYNGDVLLMLDNWSYGKYSKVYDLDYRVGFVLSSRISPF